MTLKKLSRKEYYNHLIDVGVAMEKVTEIIERVFEKVKR